MGETGALFSGHMAQSSCKIIDNLYMVHVCLCECVRGLSESEILIQGGSWRRNWVSPLGLQAKVAWCPFLANAFPAQFGRWGIDVSISSGVRLCFLVGYVLKTQEDAE